MHQNLPETTSWVNLESTFKAQPSPPPRTGPRPLSARFTRSKAGKWLRCKDEPYALESHNVRRVAGSRHATKGFAKNGVCLKSQVSLTGLTKELT